MDKPKHKYWGDYFATEHDGNEDNIDLTLRRYGGRAQYKLDVSDDMPWENPSNKKPPNCS